MQHDSKTLDHVARRLVQASEEDLRRFLRAPRLDPELVALLYLRVRGVMERSDGNGAVDELALAIYLTASAWQSSPEPPVDLLATLHSVIGKTLDTELSKGAVMKVTTSVLMLCLVLALPSAALAAENGTALFKGKCSPCHGVDGSGSTVMGKKLGLKPLTSAEVQKLTDEQIGQVIIKGKGKMPSFDKKVTPDQLKALLAHIRSLGK